MGGGYNTCNICVYNQNSGTQFYEKEKVMKKRKLLPILLALAMVLTMIPASVFADPVDEDFGTISIYINDVKQNQEYHSFEDAIAVANTVDLSENVRLECEGEKLIPNGDNHISITRSMTINGNNAVQVLSKTNPSGEATFAIEQYSVFQGDTVLDINNLKNATVWGTRKTSHKFTLNMINCDTDEKYATGQRVYINGTTGENYININNCNFNNNAGNCTVYSNAAGEINITGCTFENINEPININTKATTGTVNISIKNTEFTDCGSGNSNDSQWAAPIRVVNSGNISGGSQVTVDKCNFIYSEGVSSANGDVLIGDGREGKQSYDVGIGVKNTESEVMVQYPGYYYANGTTDNTKVYVHNVESNEEISYSVSVAEVDGVKYMSLKEAIKKAEEGGNTIVLLTDISADVWTQIWNIKGITIDGNGKTIKVKEIDSLENHDAILHSAGGNVFKDIIFDLTDISASNAQGNRAISAVAGDVIRNVTVLGNNNLSYGITCSGTEADNETITIENCTFKDCNYGVYDDEGKAVEKLIIKNSDFEECDYATILRSDNGEFTGNTVTGGKLNILTDNQTVTGNKFADQSRIKFYASGAEFRNNQISTDSYLDFDENFKGKVDVSENYWGGGEPTGKQLGNKDYVTGADVYYLKATMNPEDLNTYVPNEGQNPEDQNKPEAKPDSSAQTGDDFNMAIPFAAAGLALAALAAAVATRKRHN